MVHRIASILSLPSELKHHIAQLSSPDSLASLAWIHTGYQIEAERALYHTLNCDVNSLRCMETLATNPQKATYVCFLTMEGGSNKDKRAMTCLLKALINMHSLSDFRLTLRQHDVNEWIEDLEEILCRGHFRLKTLYCNDRFDVSRIIKSQTELQILGIYVNDYTAELLKKTLKRFHDAQLPLPIVLTLAIIWHPNKYDTIGIFPGFYSLDRSAAIHQAVIKSLEEDQGSDMRVVADKVYHLSMHLIDSSNMHITHLLAKAMAASFPRVFSLDFEFESPCEVPLQEMKQVLGFFSDLQEVHFRVVLASEGNRNAGPTISEDTKRAHVKEWEVALPELCFVEFIDCSSLHKKLNRGWDYDNGDKYRHEFY